MRQIATSLAMSTDLAVNLTADDRRRADAWRALHRRPACPPDAVLPVAVPRRSRLAGLLARRRQDTTTVA
jgi:hypothetical protein